jgi:predicted nucleic acid-binding protein
MTPRVVFDCVVLLQGAGRPSGPARACITLLHRFTLCLSAETFAEISDVLNRPKIRRRFPHLTDKRVESFLKDIETKATSLKEYRTFSLIREIPTTSPTSILRLPQTPVTS